jgi:hypothetical protein
MAHFLNRRNFLEGSVMTAGLLGTAAAVARTPGEKPNLIAYICKTCGTQFAESEHSPESCPICKDERQYVGWGGQQWTHLAELQGRHHNTITELEPGLWAIHTDPTVAIGQQAYLVRTPDGNVLWDCISLVDEVTKKKLIEMGGISAIAISHPHFYTSMVEWSRAFGDVPVHLHEADRKWVMRPDKCIQFWTGGQHKLPGGLTLINSGGHFDGFQVLHWPAGAGGKGALLSADQPMVCMDRHWVTFLYSYPNMIPLGPSAIRRITSDLQPFEFERIYGGFPGRVVTKGAKRVVMRSAERYLKMIAS